MVSFSNVLIATCPDSPYHLTNVLRRDQVVKGFQVKIFDELYHHENRIFTYVEVVKGFQVKIFDELYHRR